jgi:hypothetical protein
MQIIEEKKQPVIKTDVEIFKDGVYGMFNVMKGTHTNLMKVWDKPNFEEIIRGVGVDAKTIFEQSYAIQMILKTTDINYEFIAPYKLVEIKVPAKDANGEDRINNDGDVILIKKTIKVALNITFKADGSVDSITEIV